eukprot:IDg19655t1
MYTAMPYGCGVSFAWIELQSLGCTASQRAAEGATARGNSSENVIEKVQVFRIPEATERNVATAAAADAKIKINLCYHAIAWHHSHTELRLSLPRAVPGKEVSVAQVQWPLQRDPHRRNSNARHEAEAGTRRHPMMSILAERCCTASK